MKRGDPKKIHPNFKVGSNVRRAKFLLLESTFTIAVLSLVEGFLDNSIVMEMEVEHDLIVVHKKGYIESIHPCTILVHSGSAHMDLLELPTLSQSLLGSVFDNRDRP